MPEIVIVDNEQVKVYVKLQDMKADFYTRELLFSCEVYTHLKGPDSTEIARRTFRVSNQTYRVPVVNQQGDPVMLDFPANEDFGLPAESEQKTIGNFDLLYAAYFMQFQLKQQIEAAMVSEFTKTPNPLPPFVQP
jgi:hypothetical protein